MKTSVKVISIIAIFLAIGYVVLTQYKKDDTSSADDIVDDSNVGVGNGGGVVDDGVVDDGGEVVGDGMCNCCGNLSEPHPEFGCPSCKC